MWWTMWIESVRGLILVVAQLCNGSLGTAVVLTTLVVRLAFLPLAIRLARRSRHHQRILASIRPELEHLKDQHGHDPITYVRAVSDLHRQVGYRPIDPGSLLALALQWPLMLALYAAVRRGLGTRVRFLWIPDLARANAPLALGVAALAGVGALIMPIPEGAPPWFRFTAIVGPLFTLSVLLATSSTIGLSYGAGSLVSLAQAWMVRRDGRREAAAGTA